MEYTTERLDYYFLNVYFYIYLFMMMNIVLSFFFYTTYRSKMVKFENGLLYLYHQISNDRRESESEESGSEESGTEESGSEESVTEESVTEESGTEEIHSETEDETTGRMTTEELKIIGKSITDGYRQLKRHLSDSVANYYTTSSSLKHRNRVVENDSYHFKNY